MLIKVLAAVLFAFGLSHFGVAQAATKESVEERRAEVRKASQQVLKHLYRVSPSARGTVASSAGYAVFGNFGMKTFVADDGTGSGIAVTNASQKETFMKIAKLQAGSGFDVEKYRVVFVFESEKALNEFINSGWEFGSRSTAAATDRKPGVAHQGAMSVSPGVWMYQMTDKGLATELTGNGTKYYKDDELN